MSLCGRPRRRPREDLLYEEFTSRYARFAPVVAGPLVWSNADMGTYWSKLGTNSLSPNTGCADPGVLR